MIWRALALLSAMSIATVQASAAAAQQGDQSNPAIKLLTASGETFDAAQMVNWSEAAVIVALALTGFLIARSLFLRFIQHL